MKLIYVAGPYRATSECEVENNIRRASDLAAKVWKEHCAVICPHKNTHGLGGTHSEDKAKDFAGWMAGDLEIVRRCDAIVATDDWPKSEGARMEVEKARSLGKPVFTESDWALFLNWLIQEETKGN